MVKMIKKWTVMNRRQFLFTGLALAGSATLGIQFWQYSLTPQADNRTLVLAAILPALLYGALPDDPQEARSALERTGQAVQDFMHFLPLRQQQQLDQLFNLMAHRFSRLGLTGLWLNLEELTLQQRVLILQRWRDSYLLILQQAYHGLRELLYGAFYGQPEHWHKLAYIAPRFR